MAGKAVARRLKAGGVVALAAGLLGGRYAGLNGDGIDRMAAEMRASGAAEEVDAMAGDGVGRGARASRAGRVARRNVAGGGSGRSRERLQQRGARCGDNRGEQELEPKLKTCAAAGGFQLRPAAT